MTTEFWVGSSLHWMHAQKTSFNALLSLSFFKPKKKEVHICRGYLLECDAAHREVAGTTRTEKEPLLYIGLSCLPHTYLCEFQNQYLHIPLNELRSWSSFNCSSSEIVPGYCCWSHAANWEIPFSVYKLWIQAIGKTVSGLSLEVVAVSKQLWIWPNHWMHSSKRANPVWIHKNQINQHLIRSTTTVQHQANRKLEMQQAEAT